MPKRSVDPARLSGEALRQWYLRSPAEIAVETEAAEAGRHRDFFGPAPAEDPDAEFLRTQLKSSPDDDVLWVANGRGRYSRVRLGSDDFLATLEPDNTAWPDDPPYNAAAPEDAELQDIGNPHNRRLKREYIAKHGSWPKTADGRDYHVAHIKATADGGTQTLDNIRPMDPDDHMAEHRRNQDDARWGRRAGIAAAFGGKVEPWLPQSPRRASAAPATPAVSSARTPPLATAPRGATARRPAPSTTASSPKVAAAGAGPPKAGSGASPGAALPKGGTAATSARGNGSAGRTPGPKGLAGPRIPKLGLLGMGSDILGILSGRIAIRTDTWDNYQSDMLGQPSLEDRRKATEEIQRRLNPKWKPGDPLVV